MGVMTSRLLVCGEDKLIQSNRSIFDRSENNFSFFLIITFYHLHSKKTALNLQLKLSEKYFQELIGFPALDKNQYQTP